MNEMLSLALSVMGVIFLIFAVVFAVKKEKACKLIGGFNFFTEEQQARYDRQRLAKDYCNLFILLTADFFIGAVLCLWLGWPAFAAAMIVLLILVFYDFHWDAEKAFAKYKLNP